MPEPEPEPSKAAPSSSDAADGAPEGAAHGGHHRGAPPTGKRLAVLSLTALGVVYGDIGTSPLYAIKECFGHVYGLAADARERLRRPVAGVLGAHRSWSSGKYISFILRADNRGEGGILALLALMLPATHTGRHRQAQGLLDRGARRSSAPRCSTATA